jgi:hypothetical protein
MNLPMLGQFLERIIPPLDSPIDLFLQASGYSGIFANKWGFHSPKKVMVSLGGLKRGS